jgi:hypothetical protein
MDHRQLLRNVAAGRVVVGAALVVLPGTASGTWIGPAARDPAVKVMVRAMGARDLAIGAGTMHALSEGAPVKMWSLAGAASDLVDAAATLLAIRHVGLRRGVPLVLVATAAGVASYLASQHVD